MELLVVGLDGLSYNMLEEFGVETPFLDSVRSDGISGDLRSIDTPTTLPAWTSFATGKDPGSHGVTTMLTQSADYSITPASVNTTDTAVYDLLEDSAFVNLPGSIGREPAASGTHLVSSILSSGPEDAVPEPLQALDSFDGYTVHDEGSLKSNPEAYVEHLCETVRARCDFTAELFERENPRIGFVLFSTPDWVGHFLQYAPDESTRRQWYRSVVELCDECAAELVERAGAENVLCLSDHGFEHKPKAIHLQTWLERESYLRKAGSQSPVQRVATGAAKQVARRFDTVFDILRAAYLRFNSDGEGGLGGVVDFNPDVDFAASRAWQLRYGCLYVNDERFDSPTVDDPDALREELRERLASLTDDDGKQVFEWVGFPEEAYANPDPEARLPDVIARPASGYLPLRAFSPTGDPVIPKPGHEHYDHRYRGIVAAEGPLFEPGTVDGMSIVDVVPTLLHALKEPLLPDFDGEARTDVLAASAEPVIMDEADVPRPRVREESVDRKEAAREQLRDLGYLE